MSSPGQEASGNACIRHRRIGVDRFRSTLGPTVRSGFLLAQVRVGVVFEAQSVRLRYGLVDCSPPGRTDLESLPAAETSLPGSSGGLPGPDSHRLVFSPCWAARLLHEYSWALDEVTEVGLRDTLDTTRGHEEVGAAHSSVGAVTASRSLGGATLRTLMPRSRPARVRCAVNQPESSHQAARAYSWMSPPSRSRRTIGFGGASGRG